MPGMNGTFSLHLCHMFLLSNDTLDTQSPNSFKNQNNEKKITKHFTEERYEYFTTFLLKNAAPPVPLA